MDAALQAQIAEREGVIARVKDILIDKLHLDATPETIDLDVALFGSGLGMDSVDALELVVTVEAAFGVAIEQALMRSAMRTVNSLVDLLLATAPASAVPT